MNKDGSENPMADIKMEDDPFYISDELKEKILDWKAGKGPCPEELEATSKPHEPYYTLKNKDVYIDAEGNAWPLIMNSN